MDIAIVKENCIKLKGKQATFIVDPMEGMPKTSADAIILLDGGRDAGIERATDFRMIIDGPGEYEVGGVKISGIKTPKGTLYRLSVDGISIILGCATDAEMEGFNVAQVAVVNTASNFNESFVTAMEPKITVLYGKGNVEAAKALGAESVSLTPKLTIVKDKLPEKMEIIALG